MVKIVMKSMWMLEHAPVEQENKMMTWKVTSI
jgi:hypothetical protein